MSDAREEGKSRRTPIYDLKDAPPIPEDRETVDMLDAMLNLGSPPGLPKPAVPPPPPIPGVTGPASPDPPAETTGSEAPVRVTLGALPPVPPPPI